MTIRVDITEGDSGRHRVSLNGRVLAEGYGPVCCNAARVLVGEGHDPAEQLEAHHHGVLSMIGNLGMFAEMTVVENRLEGPRFRKWRPFDPEGRLPVLPRLQDGDE